MAHMFPDALDALPDAAEHTPTEGERILFGVLRDALQPDRDYLCFYETAIGEESERRWPDFILFGTRLGLFAIEVKDWRADQITGFDHAAVHFSTGGRERRKGNPERQAKSYADGIVRALRRQGIKPTERGCGIPVRHLVALPFIDHATYVRRRFDTVLPETSVLLADDLDPASERFLGLEAVNFADRLSSLQVFRCPVLTQHDVDRIQDVLWPRCVSTPKRTAEGKAALQREVKYLDRWQVHAARAIEPGHQLVKGPPGSGKTLILVHRCKFLSLHHEGKRILLLGFNLALTSFLKRLVQEQGLAVGKVGIHVTHFFELCSQIIGQSVEFDFKPADEAFQYYECVVEETEKAIASGTSKVAPFDAVLVDEGQDFNERQLRIVRGMVRDGGDLVIAFDTKQDLYNPGRNLAGTWKSLGIDIVGHVTTLKRVYRSTRALRNFCSRFASRDPAEETEDNEQHELPFPSHAGLQGAPPELVACSNDAALLKALTADLASSLTLDGYSRAEIGILYDDKDYSSSSSPSGFRYGDRTLGESLKEALESAGVPVQWVSEDVHAKRLFDITRDSVILSSVHSAKGLDFDLVYLIHPGWPAAGRKEIRRRIEPTYVAITRAKFRLVVLYEQEDQIVRRMIDARKGSACSR